MFFSDLFMNTLIQKKILTSCQIYFWQRKKNVNKANHWRKKKSQILLCPLLSSKSWQWIIIMIITDNNHSGIFRWEQPLLKERRLQSNIELWVRAGNRKSRGKNSRKRVENQLIHIWRWCRKQISVYCFIPHSLISTPLRLKNKR